MNPAPPVTSRWVISLTGAILRLDPGGVDRLGRNLVDPLFGMEGHLWGEGSREAARGQERLDGTGIVPLVLIAVARQRAAPDVLVEHIGNFEFAASRWFQAMQHVEDTGSEEIDADRNQVALRMIWLLLEAQHA